MKLSDKHIKWCWNNNWYVDVVPYKFNPSPTPDVRLEVHNRTEYGTKAIQVGKEIFSQKSDKDKVKIYEKVNNVYKLIYNKYNESK